MPSQSDIRTAWLRYFNRYLLEKGIITREEYLRMEGVIAREG
ncbi:hypothetical protein [Dysosmobacter sp. HCP28S3_G4]